MKIYNRVLIFMIGFVALSYCGCSKQKPLKPETMSIQANEPVKKRLEDAIKAHPKVLDEYYIKVIKPDPNIDYKIVQVEPDPNIDYKIIIIDPIRIKLQA